MAYAISWNMDEGQKNSVFLCLNNRLCESRYLLHVCCVMSHKTITCECEGESLVTVTCYEISDLRDVTVAALWRRQVTQAVDITHPMLVMILVLSCTHLHLTSHMSVDSMLSTARIWSHVTALSSLSPMFADSVSRSDCAPVSPLLCSRSALQSPGYLARLWSARLTPGQGETHRAQWNSPARARVSQDSEIFPDVLFCLKANNIWIKNL